MLEIVRTQSIFETSTDELVRRKQTVDEFEQSASTHRQQAAMSAQ
jgi:hypothetical protein